MTADLSPHAHLLALIGDALHAGLDAARVRIGPRAEREIIAAAVEHIEIGHYRLVLDPIDAEARGRADEDYRAALESGAVAPDSEGRADKERQLLAERCEDLLERWSDEDDTGQARVW